VDRDVDGMVSRVEQQVTLLGGLDPHRKEDRSATGSADAEVAVPLVDVCEDFGNDGDPAKAGAVMRIGRHDAGVIGSGG